MPVMRSPTTDESVAPFMPPIDGPSQRLPLLVFPVSADLPKTWRVTSERELTVLRGYSPFSRTPDDEVEVLLTVGQPIKPATLDLAVQSEQKKDAGSDLFTVRTSTHDGIRVVETLEYLETQPGESPSHPRWVFRLYVESGGLELNTYEFNFANMTRERLAKDEAFLRKIMDSVRLEGKPS